MKIRGILKKLMELGLIYLTLFLLVFYSRELSAGVKNGLETAFGFVIPSLFLFMIVSNLLMRSAAGRLAALPFRFLSRLLKIGREDVLIVVLSLLGGYPVGAKLLGDAVREGRMCPEDAERMLCFCVNCGPAFLISGVGVSVFGSLQLGFYLYLSQIAACLFTGWLTALTSKKAVRRPPLPDSTRSPLSELVVSSVADAVQSLLLICGFVVAFSAFIPLAALPLEGLGPLPSCVLRGVLEVTTGCTSLADIAVPHRLLLAAGFTAFGGVCVLLQIAAMLKGTGIQMKRFLLYRIPYTAVSILTVQGLLQLTPSVVDVITYNHTIPRRLFTVSPVASLFLLLLALMLLFFRRKAGIMKPNSSQEAGQ